MEYRQALARGTVLGDRYNIVGVLGQGGFGLTYEAQDLPAGGTVAIKEYFPKDHAIRDGGVTVRASSSNNEDVFAWGRSKFLEEAGTQQKFNHPNIARVIGVLESNGTAYLVQEFVNGPKLGDWLDGLGRLPTQDEMDGITDKLLDALETVHAGNYVHRDIAPDNILMRRNHEPVLIDFGAARMAVGARTQTMHSLVKPGYSPTEQYALDTKLLGTWTDIYALAATLYRAVTGAAPPDSLTRSHGDRMVPAVKAGAGKFRPQYLAAIDQGLALKQNDRPQTIRAWRAKLVEGREMHGGKNNEVTQMVTPPPKQSRGLQWAILALLLGLGGMGAWAFQEMRGMMHTIATTADEAKRTAAEVRDFMKKQVADQTARERAEVDLYEKVKATVNLKADDPERTPEAGCIYVRTFPGGRFVTEVRHALRTTYSKTYWLGNSSWTSDTIEAQCAIRYPPK